MKDFNTYKLNLSKSIEEKVFFMNHIDINEYDLILDFGCGTGELLNAIAQELHNDNTILIGYDINKEMLKVASRSVFGHPAEFISSLERLSEFMHDKVNTLIIFSSVLHEIDANNQMKIIKEVMPLFSTIVIRDMKRPLNNEPISNITRKRILNQVAPWQAQMFESRWGKIRDKETMYRFFLMNEFVENFETEVEEDYFGVLWSDIKWELESHHYYTIYERTYTLPYRKQQVKRRFNHVMHDITHGERIFQQSSFVKTKKL